MKLETPPSVPATSEGSSAASAPHEGSGADDSRSLLATLDFALMRGALEEIPFGVATTRAGVILYANEALARIFGARQGGLEQMHVSQLFDAGTFSRIAERLQEERTFDGRVVVRGLDGRRIDAEVHVERYTSEAQGTGGFLVVRDVSLELGALGRLVDQLGGALFRVRVWDGAIEHVSPAITRLIGLDAALCTQHPVLLTALLSVEERERVLFLYRRIASGEIVMATAQVSLRRQDGATRIVQIRATGRRDTSGVVCHIDGVLTDAAREIESNAAAHTRADAAHASKDAIAGAAMELSHELLREGSQQGHAITRELKAARSALRTNASSMPKAVVDQLAFHLDALASVVAGTAAVNRAARRVLGGATTFGAPLGELLERVRATLAPLLGEPSLSIDAGDAANVVVIERVEELGAAIIYLALRAFRFSGSGTLRIAAWRSTPPPETAHRADIADAHARTAGRTHGRGSVRPPPEPEHVTVEIHGSAPAELGDASVEISSDMLRTAPRPREEDQAYQAAQTLLAAAGGVIESDDATFSTARSILRLKL